ncbi:MAG TPA: hypothetical protein ENJ53_09635 [Phaeodactylibacter sp.]|nr:hypothetical protein [Phaeodactylibacter sp.]
MSYPVLLKAVQSLPPDCRVVFCMSIIEGFSILEICERLEISKQTAEFCLQKAWRIID